MDLIILMLCVVRPTIAAITIFPTTTSVTIAISSFQNMAVIGAGIITHWFGFLVEKGPAAEATDAPQP